MGGYVDDRSGEPEQVTLLAVGGTGESFVGDRRREVNGLLRDVTSGLDERFRCRWIGYPASYGPAPQLDGMSYLESVAIGVDALRAALAETSGPVALIGYSQGAVVIRTAVHDLYAAGDPSVERILAMGFVADPHQPPRVVEGCSGWGVAGAGPALPPGTPAHWVGAPDDMICNASEDSFIRDIADLTAGLAFGRLRDWLMLVRNRLQRNDLQNAHRTSPGFSQIRRDITRLASAAREVVGYLPDTLAFRGLVVRNRRGGRHTSYAREPYRRASVTDPDTTGCQDLAAWLQVCATFLPVVSYPGPADRSLAA
ncbi:PE-PPE domain-containing protein [Gordonia insulae]|uniref:PE-PPE domain-containing protein n=1 Tax=Gordonia insulae TaxID=2420509 RepID=A0A3G8JFW7_9ACTN|nr:PE-PPE domain-containing protein [Gordonia insulae]AZG43976.1 hypothetical protein D7316_00554 [Gordonia insulae]